jgi:hypothetical protein
MENNLVEEDWCLTCDKLIGTDCVCEEPVVWDGKTCLECGKLLSIECACGPGDTSVGVNWERSFPFHPMETPQD